MTGNNQRDALVVVEDRREKLLYIEGGPRFEMKFLRQAVADDRNLQVVTLQRTADRKFLRLDVEAAVGPRRWVPQDARGAVRLPGTRSWAASRPAPSRPINSA